MNKYKIEVGIETKTTTTTVKYFGNAKELKLYIKQLNSAIWYVVEYTKSKQVILSHNFKREGTVYNEYIKCPKVLQGIK